MKWRKCSKLSNSPSDKKLMTSARFKVFSVLCDNCIVRAKANRGIETLGARFLLFSTQNWDPPMNGFLLPSPSPLPSPRGRGRYFVAFSEGSRTFDLIQREEF